MKWAWVLMALGLAMGARGNEGPVPVLVELFTSEGCSSCPPADRVLSELSAEQPVEGAEIVALAFHVDYWNRLGWIDPYSSKAYTERQYGYAARWDSERVYTPQMVVDGREEFVGSDGGHARRAVQEAASRGKGQLRLRVALEGERANIAVEAVDSELDGALFVAITEDGLVTDVPQGENGGRTLRHSGVVREWRPLGDVRGKKRVESGVDVSTLDDVDRGHVVAFTQDESTGAVLAVATCALSPVQ